MGGGKAWPRRRGKASGSTDAGKPNFFTQILYHSIDLSTSAPFFLFSILFLFFFLFLFSFFISKHVEETSQPTRGNTRTTARVGVTDNTLGFTFRVGISAPSGFAIFFLPSNVAKFRGTGSKVSCRSLRSLTQDKVVTITQSF